jgi:hypothetical protein
MAHATIDGGGGGPDAAFAAETTPPAALSWKKAGWAALQLFAGGGLLALIGIFLASKIDGRLFSTCCAIVPTAVFATGFLRGLHALYLLVRARGRGFNALGASVIALPVLAGGFFTLVGTFLTMWSTTGFSRGRTSGHPQRSCGAMAREWAHRARLRGGLRAAHLEPDRARRAVFVDRVGQPRFAR